MTGFFMLSGYSLWLAYGKKNLLEANNIKGFYIKRLITIYPLYIVMGTLAVLMEIMVGRQSITDNIILLPIELLGIQAFFDGSLFSFSHNGGTWFVSCILICYFMFPFLKELIRRLNSKGTTWLLLLILALLPYSYFLSTRYDGGIMYTNAFFRVLEFFLGMLVAKINIESKNDAKFLKFLRSWQILLITLAILVIGLSILNHYKVRNEIFLYPCLVIIFISLGYQKFPQQLYNKRWILYASGLAYSFYLSQFLIWNPAKFVQLHLGEFGNMTKITGTLIATLFFSILSHEIIEKRLVAYLKKKLI